MSQLEQTNYNTFILRYLFFNSNIGGECRPWFIWKYILQNKSSQYQWVLL